MEDLRQTALAYYIAAPDDIRRVVEEFFKEMDPNKNGHVRFKEFCKYMETYGFQHMASDEFFEELKQPRNEVLYFDDVLTLYYIIQSGRPFCGGLCKKFVKGLYFTCVKCFFGDQNTTFSVCSQCFGAEKYEHCHNDFLDPIVLLQYKRIEALTKQGKKSCTNAAGKREASSSASTILKDETKKSKYGRSTSSVRTVLVGPSPASTASSSSSPSSQSNKQDAHNSISNAIVPAVNKQSRQTKMQTAIQLGQLLASIGGIVVASQTCTIL